MNKVLVEKQWFLKTKPASKKLEEFKAAFDEMGKNMPEALVGLLMQRGVENMEDALTYFKPKLKDLHSPWQMKDMDKAVDRILKALEEKEKIMILGDYDVDGTTSAAMMHLFLKSMDAECFYYIPDRYLEGYGISQKSIQTAIDEKVSVFISLDCGIKAIEHITAAADHNIDVIVCDHHNPGDQLPPAYAVLDPKRQDCDYPFKELSGCGVGFKLIQAILEKRNLDPVLAYEYLDLLATSIGADIVSMTGENRILARFGLHKINHRPLPGIAAIKSTAKFQKDFTISDVVFKIAPRINSAGRMASGNKAVELLIGKELNEVEKIVGEINQFNVDRGVVDKDMAQEALGILKADPLNTEKKTTVLYDPDWHKGVIGIVASRMIESFYRPTIIFTGKEGILSGSARSVKHFSVYNAIEACSDLLIQYGGHKYAAGMTMKEENFEAFQKKFEEVVASTIKEEWLIPSIEVDWDLSLSDVNKEFMKVLKHFAPFGPDNMNPVFQSAGILPYGIQPVGAEKTHLKMRVFDPNFPAHSVPAIGFGFGHLAEEMDEGTPFDMVYSLEENHWNGRTEIQLQIKDIRL